MHKRMHNRFPSPLGVIFSLIEIVLFFVEYKKDVSVSSRSYILSYYKSSNGTYWNIKGFRLLSELYSLLFYYFKSEGLKECYVSVSSRSYILSYEIGFSWKLLERLEVSVSSRSYILSYLWGVELEQYGIYPKFPSPLGVIFSLMFHINYYFYMLLVFLVSVSSRSYILSYRITKM